MRNGLIAAAVILVLGALAVLFWPREIERDRAPANSASVLLSADPGPFQGETPGAEQPGPPETAAAPAEGGAGPAPAASRPPLAEGGAGEAEPGGTAAVDGEDPAAGGEPERLAALPPAGEGATTAEPSAGRPAATDGDRPEADAGGGEEPSEPVFDLVRVSPDGQAVIAGRAEPRQSVDILLDGELLATARADERGAFVAVAEAPQSDEPREMVLRVRRGPAERQTAARAPPGSAAEPGLARGDPAYAFSAPVIVLPGADADGAPAVVRSTEDSLDVVQPAMAQAPDRMALDRLTFESGGEVLATGRGPEASAIRAYANGRLVAEVGVGEDGDWRAVIPEDVARETELLRFDEVSAEGEVLSRLEAPFEQADEGTVQRLSEQSVTIERGNNLWRIAERHYGEGLRYSVIFAANSELIRDPDLIYPGQVFAVPELVEAE